MKSRVKKLQGTSRQIDIEMPKDAVDKAFNEVLEDIRKTANIPGFRVGKAPMDIITRDYGKDAMDEVKRRLIPLAYQQALEEHLLKPVSFPEVSDVTMHPSGALLFTAKVDVHPAVAVRNYKGLKVVQSKISVKDDEVEEVLTRLRNINAEFVDSAEAVRKGDFAICDVETFVDGELAAKKRENMWVEADKDVSLLGMGEDLCGMNKGQVKDVDVTLPENYPDKKYAGKKAVFRVEVKDVKVKKLPELDDELAKKLGKDTLSEAREEIRTQLLERKDANVRVHMKNQVMAELLKKSSFDIPGSMVERQLKVLLERAENELAAKGVDKQAIESHKDKFRDQLRAEAENKVRIYFILDHIADKENIQVSEDEINEWLRSLAGAYNKPFEEVEKYYRDHDLIGGLGEQLREEKTLDFLLSEAVISEK